MVILVATLNYGGQVNGHEVIPNIADIQFEGKTISIKLRMNVEAFLSNMDLSQVKDTDEAAQIKEYEIVRALSPDELRALFEANWVNFTSLISLKDSNGQSLKNLTLESLDIEDIKNTKLPRLSNLSFSVNSFTSLSAITVSFDERLGATYLRQVGVENGLEQNLYPGDTSDTIQVFGGQEKTKLTTFLGYIPIGLNHVIPSGVDHILFILGLFFLSLKIPTLLWQISAFTLAHSITLIAGALDFLQIPGYIVEPLIAASIVYVAVENIFFSKLNYYRTVIVFCFGLLHGFGFASVLNEFGMPQSYFLSALLGFNVGVEVGQLCVIAIAYLLLGLPFGKTSYYRIVISIPASVIIACVGIGWVLERTLFA